MLTIAQATKRADPDNIAIWSVAPYDVTTTADWPEIESAFKAIARKQTVVEQVSQTEVDAAAGKITVVS